MIKLIAKRAENSKTFDLGSGKRRLEVSIGAIHYKDNYADKSEQWKDIDLTWEGNRITKAPYELTLEVNKITVRDKKTGDISTIELLEVGGQRTPAQAWAKSKGLAKAFDTDIEIVAENTRISFARILKSSTAPKEAKYRVTGKIPLRVSARDTEDELPVEWALKDGILSETLKPDRPVKYPVRIDPTLDLQVGAQTDDICFHWTGAAWYSYTDNSSILVGWDSASACKYGCGLRFLNVTIPNAETITTAYLTIKCPYAKAGTVVNSVIIGEDADNAATFSTTADYQARRGTIVGGANNNNITTASVNWNAIPAWTADVDYNSPEIKTIIQEVVDRVGWASGQAMVIFWDDHGDNSTHDTDVRRYGYGYLASSTNCAKLHIEYTPVGIGAQYIQMSPFGVTIFGGKTN